MPSIKTGPTTMGTHWIAIPAAVSLVLFLGYSSQWLYYYAPDLDPGPLSANETIIFNTLLLCLWWTYYQACTVDPGRYVFESRDVKGQELTKEPAASRPSSSDSSSFEAPTSSDKPVRWCKKCAAPKPPRAHHCKHCKRCIPKMDHHCPWTGNCVSLQTFPHFFRFVLFTNLSLWMCAYLLSLRFLALWNSRSMPAYLGPTLPQLIHLSLLGLVCGATCFALAFMLYGTVHSFVLNQTMIELWEIERHEAVIERYNKTSSDGTWWDEDEESEEESEEESDYEDSDDEGENKRPRPRKVEFPYDVGFFANMTQAMGTANALLWFFPFAGAPKIAPGGKGSGWDWPENGFNNEEGMWPPPDPEKQRNAARSARVENEGGASSVFASGRDDGLSPEEQKAAFQERQQADFRRRTAGGSMPGLGNFPRLRPNKADDVFVDDDFEEGMDGKPGWMNSDGDRLRDYGVDEEAEFDDENVPLGELLRRKAALKGSKAQ